MKRTLFNPVLVLSLLLAAIVAFLNVTSTLAQGNKVSLTDSSTPTPTSTLRPPGSELDEDASLWSIYNAGNATGIVDNVADPSLDGRSLRCALTGGDPYSAMQCYRTLPAQPDARVFTLSMSFFYRPASSPQALEFNMSKWNQNNRYQWALQWDNAGGTKWRYWDPANQWVDLGVSGPLAAEQWHTLVLQGDIRNGQVHYSLFMLDGQAHDLDSTVAPVSTSGEPDRLTVAVQLDGNDVPTPYELFVDHLLLNIAVPTPTLSSLKEISYYPKDYAWEQMWLQWPEAKVEMDQDLDRIKALGVNTVRIFLQPSAFGYPGVPNATQSGYFDEALALIDAHGLKAHVTLFDCWGSWADISGSETWLAAIVAPHKDDPRITLWELKNEIIFDPSKPEYQTVRDWFQALFPFLKAQAGNTPVTVSVYNVEWLADVKALSGATPPDIYSLHWYPNEVVWTDEFPRIIDRAHVLIDQAPLLIGEFGLSTYTYSDDLQADLVTNVLYYAHQKGITNLGFWTLNDFPTNTFICCVMPKAEQWYYGLYRTDGTQKPAAPILKAAFQGNPPSSLSPRRVLNNLSFEDLNPYSGYLYYWWPWDQDWTGQHWEVQDCTIAHSGTCSAKLHGPVSKDVGLYNILAFPIDPGKLYSVEAWVRTENLDGSACIVFSWFDQYGAWLSNTANCVTDPNLAKWTPIRIVDAKPAQPPLTDRTAAYAEVFVQVTSSDPNSLVWFDDVKPIPLITFGPAPTPIYPGGNFTVNATTTNTDSAALTYSVVSGPCALVGSATFRPSGAGVCVIKANGAATANFAAALQTQKVVIAMERVKNGGFNVYTDAPKIPTFWVKSATFAATDGKDTIIKKEGTASVKIVGAAGKVKTLTQTLTLSGLAGDKFTFSFWARGASIPAAGLCQGQVLLYSGATLKLTKTVPCSNGTYDFQKKTLSFNAISAYTKVVIKFTYSKASGTVWFDAVSLIK
ncbi:MAG: hypothetical protein WA821_21415 [Anaerolineales bacterium]